jgi:hypothetical protein
MAAKKTKEQEIQKVTITVTGEARKALLAECGKRRAAGRHDWSIRQVIEDALIASYGK